MSVAKGDRKQSKVEFDNAYFKVYEDCVRLSMSNFGGKENLIEQYSQYIQVMKQETLSTTCEIGRQIRIANSIYPTCKLESETRRVAQDKAIGLCLLFPSHIMVNRFH